MHVNPMPSPLRGAHAQRGLQKTRGPVVEDEGDIAGLVNICLSVVATPSSKSHRAAIRRRRWRSRAAARPHGSRYDLLGSWVASKSRPLLRTGPATANTPIISTPTARTTESDSVRSVSYAGADDYVTKPFSPRELAVRRAPAPRQAPAAGRCRRQISRPAPGRRFRCGVDQRRWRVGAAYRRRFESRVSGQSPTACSPAIEPSERVWGYSRFG